MAADDLKKRGLGRGLSALLGDENEDYASLDQVRLSKTVPIEFLKPGKFQPRKTFDPDAIDALVESITQQGILQPLLVRRDPGKSNEYEIIAGERRWRAAQKAGLSEVPVVIKDLSDNDALAIAIIENIQREDLTPIEEAAAYQRLIDEFSYTQEALAKTVGKSRSHVANMLRLLTLPGPIKTLVDTGTISAGHARALIGVEHAESIAAEIVSKGLNVRQTEKLAQSTKPIKAKTSRPADEKDADTAALERDLSNLLGLTVNFKLQGEGGVLSIQYKTLEQLDDVLHRLTHGNVPSGA